MEAVGNCRSCMVEIKGERVLAASCCRAPTAGMQVTTNNERVRKAQQMVHRAAAVRHAGEGIHPPQRSRRMGGQAEGRQAALRAAPAGAGGSVARRRSPSISTPAFNARAACAPAATNKSNDVIGLAFRGQHAKIVFDMDDPMGASTCVACGECVQACPTGALMPAREVALSVPDKSVDSLCPYCGVGCQLTYHVKNDSILYVEGRDGPANHSRLCVKGRYGFDYSRHPQRLTVPLIRRADAPKAGNFVMDPNNVMQVFREATWEEAIALGGGTLRQVARHLRPESRWPDSAPPRAATKRRTCFRNWCASVSAATMSITARASATPRASRRCSRASARARSAIRSWMSRRPRSSSLSAPIQRSIIRSRRPSSRTPCAAGTKLIVMDPRRSDLARTAYRFLQFKPDTDVALLNAMMHVIIEENLVDAKFIADRTLGYAELAKNVKGYNPELMAPICGVPGRDHSRSRAAVCDQLRLHDSLGHGHQPAHPRHRQRPLPHCAVIDDGTDRQARHGAAPAARPEQRAGRIGRRAHSR